MSDEKETKDDTLSNNHSVARVDSHEISQAPICSLNTINVLDSEQVAKAEVFLRRMLKSEKSGIKTIEDGLAMIMKAQDLGLPFSSCVEHIHIISGKTGIDIHIIKALLLKAGVTWECLNDYTPQYEYTDGFNVFVENKLPDYAIKCKNSKEAAEKAKVDATKDLHDNIYVYPVAFYSDFKGNIYKEYQLNSKFAIAANRGEAQVIMQQQKIPIYRVPSIAVDYVTKYKLKRNLNGKEMTTIGSFSYTEAVTAEMFKKDTYLKYPKVLIGHRAFTYAARDIASDVIFGCMETSELKIVNGAELDTRDIVDITDVEEVQ